MTQFKKLIPTLLVQGFRFNQSSHSKNKLINQSINLDQLTKQQNKIGGFFRMNKPLVSVLDSLAEYQFLSPEVSPLQKYQFIFQKLADLKINFENKNVLELS